MKKAFLVLLVIASIACSEVEADKVDQLDINEAIDEFNGLIDDVVLQLKVKNKKPHLPHLPLLPHIPNLSYLHHIPPNIKKVSINLRKLRLKLKSLKIPKIKLGPKTLAFIEKIAKGAGQGIAKLKEIGLWEPLIGVVIKYGLQKASALCQENIQDEGLCQKIVESVGKVADKITGTESD